MFGKTKESGGGGKGPTRDEVLKRLLQTPPKPHKPKKDKDPKKQPKSSNDSK